MNNEEKLLKKINYLETVNKILSEEGWSNEVAKGYVIIALEDLGKTREEIKEVLGALRLAFDENTLPQAKDKYNKF